MNIKLPFVAIYTKNGVETAPSSPPTIAVMAVDLATGVESTAAAAGTAMSASGLAGRYHYELAGADLSVFYYHAKASTTDTSVDSPDLQLGWFDYSAAIASDGSGQVGANNLPAVPTVAQIAAGVLKNPSNPIAADTAGAVALPATPPAGYGTGSDTPGTTTLLTRIPGTVAPQTGDSFARLGQPTNASVSADLASLLASLAAYAKLFTPGSVADNAPTTTGFLGNSQLSATTGFYNGRTLLFVSDALPGATPVTVTAYDGPTRRLTFSPALPAAPANTDQFWIV